MRERERETYILRETEKVRKVLENLAKGMAHDKASIIVSIIISSAMHLFIVHSQVFSSGTYIIC